MGSGQVRTTGEKIKIVWQGGCQSANDDLIIGFSYTSNALCINGYLMGFYEFALAIIIVCPRSIQQTFIACLLCPAIRSRGTNN